MRFIISRSQIRIQDVAEFVLIRGLFLILLIALYRAAFCRAVASVWEVKLRLCRKVFFLDFEVEV